MENLLSGTHVLRMQPEGSGTHLTIEIASPAIDRITVFGSLLGGRIDRSMARMHEPMDAEIKELLEGNKTQQTTVRHVERDTDAHVTGPDRLPAPPPSCAALLKQPCRSHTRSTSTPASEERLRRSHRL